MSIDLKNRILSRHPYFRLRLIYAAVGSHPRHITAYRETANRIAIVLSDSGSERSSIRDSESGQILLMRPGYLYFMPCHHPIEVDLSPRLCFVSLHFNLELFYGFDVFRNYHRCYSRKAPELAAEWRERLDHQEDILTLCRLNETIYNLCVKLLSAQPETLRTSTNRWHDYQPVFDYVQKYGDATSTVHMLADMLQMSDSLFSRKFACDIGISPKVFLLHTLTRKASEMLLAPGTSIKQTAARLNFSSEYYFSNFFKKQTGLSPRDFRRNNGIK